MTSGCEEVNYLAKNYKVSISTATCDNLMNAPIHKVGPDGQTSRDEFKKFIELIGKTTISRLGDSRLRKALYMAALVAKRYNKGLAAFVSRLEQNGKTPKTIVCAIMRKLAHIIFGVLRSRLPFNENYSCI